MIGLHISTTDGGELILTRYTQPEPELTLLLATQAPTAGPSAEMTAAAQMVPHHHQAENSQDISLVLWQKVQ